MGPVEPGQLVVLGVGVVVAALGAADLVAGGQHRRAARQEERGEQGADIGGARGGDDRIGDRSFDAAVPREVGVGAVAVALAIGLVVLVGIGDEVVSVKPSWAATKLIEAEGPRPEA